MSLKGFHVVFITASVLLAFGFAAWCLVAEPHPVGTGRLLAGIASIVIGAGLVGYELWFLRKMRGVS
jgi:hypothetical protein